MVHSAGGLSIPKIKKGLMKMKETICTVAGLVGGFIATLLGGWDSALSTLVIFMGDSPQCGEMSAKLTEGTGSG